MSDAFADTGNALQADVLVIGGGLAGCWAALGAAREGAVVLLVDKGFVGTSGVTAAAGPGHWWVPPAARDDVVRKRADAGQGLAEERWMHRILDMTWRNLPTLAPDYKFGTNDRGEVQYRALRGPEYLRALRLRVLAAGVTILDHHPALELLRQDDGAVAGARGLRMQQGGAWTVRAGAVVLATGGCAFLSKLLGADNNTGDGYLMAAEAGAELSGMEFSNYYTVAPVFSSMTRSMSYIFARYYDEAGRELDIPSGPGSTNALARALLAGPVYCTLDRMPQDIRDRLPTISPNVLLPFARRGIDPFKDRFEITLRGEGTVRGIGGLRVHSEDCETSVPGLFAAGDAASRERVAGAISGGGNINSAWGLSSGLWSGQGAARRALEKGRRGNTTVQALGQAGLRPYLRPRPLDTSGLIAAVQRPMLGLDLNIFRSGVALRHSIQKLDSWWQPLREHAGGSDDSRALLRSREAAALLATARWSARAALARNESRGMHQRTDAPSTRPDLAHRISVGGLDQISIRPEPVLPANSEARTEDKAQHQAEVPA